MTKENKQERDKRLRDERKALFRKILEHPDPYSEDFFKIKQTYIDKSREITELKKQLR